MSKDIRRGYLPEDEILFSGRQYDNLCKAKKELIFLLNGGYPIKPASTFIGNHYMFAERQRQALIRAVSSSKAVSIREEKLLKKLEQIPEVNIDGFNTLITLEVALSKSPVLICMDQTVRDLAGLRGTYRIINKTKTAVHEIFQWLEEKKIGKANIYLDAPVSNSGRLKTLFYECSEEYSVKLNVEVIPDVDHTLEQAECVITSDAIILDRCKSWINMNREIIDRKREEIWRIDLFSSES